MVSALTRVMMELQRSMAEFSCPLPDCGATGSGVGKAALRPRGRGDAIAYPRKNPDCAKSHFDAPATQPLEVRTRR
jgi:hypothetical protein